MRSALEQRIYICDMLLIELSSRQAAAPTPVAADGKQDELSMAWGHQSLAGVCVYMQSCTTNGKQAKVGGTNWSRLAA